MRGRKLGFIIVISSLCFGALYIWSFITWATSILSLFGDQAWSWWVMALPIAIIVALTVFFSTWVGWVMLTASEAKKRELMGKG
ncbi:MAG: hypothetical protein NZ954_03855 [Thermofilaceae archaeon]|nr:hypothetical protein [Thermofilaceae archaeon]MCX8181293.1 hypothetical protein [Thermofilaceae archaeon]MDW8004636.1 hypothetical protein [Thermofilaceae archaeon]